MRQGDKVKVILLNDGGYPDLDLVDFPTEAVDGFYYDKYVVDVNGSVLQNLPNSKWPSDCLADQLGVGYAFTLGTNAIILNSENK